MPDMQPLIILTCMRSYSSLVSNMLGQHRGLYALPEINPFVETRIRRFEDRASLIRPRTLDGLLRAVAEIEFGGQTEETIRQAQAWMQARRHWELARTLRFLSRCCAPRRMIDKSPSTVLSDEALERAVKAFPDAHFLHLYRHPVATTRSIAKITKFGATARARPQGKDPETSWYLSNRRIMMAATRIKPGHFMSVRGEDVLRAPETYLPQICDWLGLETAAEDVRNMMHPERSPFACMGPPSAPFGHDPNFLRNPAYAKRDIPERPLSDPLDWDSPERRLQPETLAISYQLGYGDTAAATPTRS